MSCCKTDANPENHELNQILSLFGEAGRTFSRISLYKSEIGSSSGSFGALDEMFHHQGVILAVASPGNPEKFLQLDFGSDGLTYKLTAHFPVIQGLLNWDSNGEFLEAAIAPHRGHPNTLNDALDQIRGWRYALMWTNCQAFATYIWNAFMA